MTYSIAQFFLLGALTMVFVGLITAPIRTLALRVGAVDAPTLARKTQKEPIPYLGGVAIAVGIVGASYGSLLAVDFTLENFELASFVLIPAIAISAMGLWDDLKGLEPWPRLVAQTATGIIVAVILTATDTMGFAFDSQVLNYAITVLWIVGVCNSINFFDNHDGGAAGTVAVITFFLFFIAYDRQQVLVSALAIVTAGATAGFLLWNRHPAKIYMGDAGALFLGVIVSVLTIRLNPGITPQWSSIALLPMLLAVPILDTCIAVFSRIKRGISPFTGGKDHLSHRLMRKGLSKRRTAFTLWAMQGFFVGCALTVYTWTAQAGTAVIAGTGLIWLAAFVWFWRIPSTD